MLLDKNESSPRYQQAITHIAPRFSAPELTSSARILQKIVDENSDNGPLALSLSKEYKQQLKTQGYKVWSDAHFEQEQKESLKKQSKIEAADEISFDEYLRRYFKNAQA